MKVSIRLTTLATAALALAGTLGAQQRPASNGGARPESRAASRPAGHDAARPGYASGGRYVARTPAPRGNAASMAGRPGPGARLERYAPARTGYAAERTSFNERRDVRDDVRRDGYRVPVARYGRPLITRAYATPHAYGAYRRYGGELPFGWDRVVVFHGFFPVAYAGFCEAVPADYGYLLPPMAPTYDPCLFGDRVIVFDRFSRSIVFVATL
jgi:hypothetical protein